MKNKSCADQYADNSGVLNDLISKYQKIQSSPVFEILRFKNSYSKTLGYLLSQNDNGLTAGSEKYQDEEFVRENEFNASILTPYETKVCIKFYDKIMSKTTQLWYQEIAPFLLSKRIMPNIDVAIEISQTNLKYESRFAKHLRLSIKNMWYITRPKIGKTLHELIDSESLSEEDIFEICKQVDIVIDVYTRIGFAHGNLTCDTIKILSFGEKYNYKVDDMLVFTDYLAIPCDFDKMFIVKDSILESILPNKEDYNIRYDSAGRYDYLSFYLSLLYLLLDRSSQTKKYNKLKDYLVYTILAPVNVINSKHNFKLTTLFDVKDLASTASSNNTNSMGFISINIGSGTTPSIGNSVFRTIGNLSNLPGVISKGRTGNTLDRLFVLAYFGNSALMLTDTIYDIGKGIYDFIKSGGHMSAKTKWNLAIGAIIVPSIFVFAKTGLASGAGNVASNVINTIFGTLFGETTAFGFDHYDYVERDAQYISRGPYIDDLQCTRISRRTSDSQCEKMCMGEEEYTVSDNPSVVVDINKYDMSAAYEMIHTILKDLNQNKEYYDLLPTIESKYGSVITIEYISDSGFMNIYNKLLRNNVTFDEYGLTHKNTL